jgi:hypothetical protein
MPRTGIYSGIRKQDNGNTLVVDPSLSGKIAGGAIVHFLRQRVTIAQVNAGLSLVAAPGLGYALRMVDLELIAVGGAAAGATTVDILATLATASRKLVAAAVAGLTQSALLRAGAANAAILADGASFTANDENTPITIGKTGGALTTATHIDVLLAYVIDEL